MSTADLQKKAIQQLNIDMDKIRSETTQKIPEHIVEPSGYVDRPDVGNKVIYNRILNRIHNRDLDYIGIIQGERGHGKSYSALRMSEKLDKNFTTDRVFFKPIPLIDKIFELYHNDELKKGMFWVLDEGGVSWGSRTWYDDSNLYMNYMAQTFRKLGQGLFVTLPFLHLLDSQARKQRNAWMIAEEKGKLRYYRSKRSTKKEERQQGVKWDQYYRVNGEPLRTIRIDLPERIDINKYEKKKDKFLYDVLGRDIKTSDVDKETILEEFVKHAWKNKDKFIVNGRVDKSLVRVKLDLKDRSASYVKSRLSQKLESIEEKDSSENEGESSRNKIDNESLDIMAELRSMEKEHKLCEEEKEYIRSLKNKGFSQRKIATVAERDKTTINRVVNQT